jgi:hypothetical protein
MAAIDHDAAGAALREARSTVINAKWHLCQDEALARLATCPGLACAPLFPEHPVIQVVACGGLFLGRARLHRTGTTPRWIATAAPTTRPVGTYDTLSEAARALARAAGLPHFRQVTCLPGFAPGGRDE